MFHAPLQPAPKSGVPALLARLSQVSTRPRYAFMLLGLIAEVARPDGSAGPFVRLPEGEVLLRDWLSDALTPMGHRDPRRLALAAQVRGELSRTGDVPSEALVEDTVRERVRASGKTNLSRAVSELVRAGLIRRHYAGYRVDHANRGARRHVVYALAGLARCLLPARAAAPAMPAPRQGELALSR